MGVQNISENWEIHGTTFSEIMEVDGDFLEYKRKIHQKK